ncbi:MAG: hypothetical protein ACLFTD_03570, partial [Halochromatium sp.]
PQILLHHGRVLGEACGSLVGCWVARAQSSRSWLEGALQGSINGSITARFEDRSGNTMTFDEKPSSQAQPSQPLPAAVLSWLHEAEQLSRGENALYSLLYLLRLRPTATGPAQVLLGLVKVRHLKSGGYGKPARFSPHSAAQAHFIRPEDRRALALFNAQSSHRSGYDAFDQVVLGDDLGAPGAAIGRIRTARAWCAANPSPGP